jgi:hypothetical protein
VSKRVFFIPVFLFLIVPAVARSEVQIPSACRIANKPPGRCGWCALETLARHLSIRTLYGIVDKHPTQSRPRDLEAALACLEVKYRFQNRGSRSTDILREAVSKDLGAVVGLRPLYPGAGGHIVTLVNIGPKEVRILDPNDSDGRVRTMDLHSFLERWDGFALVLDRP